MCQEEDTLADRQTKDLIIRDNLIHTELLGIYEIRCYFGP